MTGMIGPSGLAAALGVLMLISAVCAVGRVIGAWRTGKATDYTVELCHGVLDVAMAGVLLPALKIVSPGSIWIWVAVCAVITAWFAVRVLRDLSSYEPDPVGPVRRACHVPQLLLAGAMVYLLATTAAMAGDGPATVDTSSGSMPGMSMGGSSGPMVAWPTLDLLLIGCLLGYVVVLLDRLPDMAARGGIGQPHHRSGSYGGRALYAPRAAAGLEIVASAGMAYLLIMLLV